MWTAWRPGTASCWSRSCRARPAASSRCAPPARRGGSAGATGSRPGMSRRACRPGSAPTPAEGGAACSWPIARSFTRCQTACPTGGPYLSNRWRAPSTLRFARACGERRRAGDRGGDGRILTLVALNELTRAGSVVVVAKHRRQREWAESFGATDVVSPGEAINEVRRSTRALKLKPERGSPFLLGGVDVAIDCVGSKGSLDLALRTTRAGGRVVMAGIPVAGVDLTPLWFRELESGWGVHRWHRGARARVEGERVVERQRDVCVRHRHPDRRRDAARRDRGSDVSAPTVAVGHRPCARGRSVGDAEGRVRPAS